MISFSIPGVSRWTGRLGKKYESRLDAQDVSFRNVDGFDSYAVGDDGSVWSCRARNGNGNGPWRELVGFSARGGYLRMNLRRDGKLVHQSVHRMVLDAFVGPNPELQVRHLNGIRTDNRLVNLVWGTAFENAVDRECHGHTLRGAAHGMALLNEQQVIEIRQRASCGVNKTALAVEFGIARTSLAHILNRRNWRHVQ